MKTMKKQNKTKKSTLFPIHDRTRQNKVKSLVKSLPEQMPEFTFTGEDNVVYRMTTPTKKEIRQKVLKVGYKETNIDNIKPFKKVGKALRVVTEEDIDRALNPLGNTPGEVIPSKKSANAEYIEGYKYNKLREAIRANLEGKPLVVTRTEKQLNSVMCATILALPLSSSVITTSGITNSSQVDHPERCVLKKLGDKEPIFISDNTTEFNKDCSDFFLNKPQILTEKGPSRIQVKGPTKEIHLDEVKTANKSQTQQKIRHSILGAREGYIAFLINNEGMTKEQAVAHTATNPHLFMITLTYKEYITDVNEVRQHLMMYSNKLAASLPKKYRDCARNFVGIIEQHKSGRLHAHCIVACPYLLDKEGLVEDAWVNENGRTRGVVHVGNKLAYYSVHQSANYLMKDELVHADGSVKRAYNEDTDLERSPKSPHQVYVHPYVAQIVRNNTYKVSMPLCNTSNLDLLQITSKFAATSSTGEDIKEIMVIQKVKDEKSGESYKKPKILQFYRSDIKDYCPDSSENLRRGISKAARGKTEETIESRARQKYELFYERNKPERQAALFLNQQVSSRNEGRKVANEVFKTDHEILPNIHFKSGPS